MNNIKRAPFIGASCAVVTPFNKDGGIDYEAFESLIERLINGSIHSITVAGTTGEASTLSDREHHRLISCAVDTVGGKVPVVAGAGSNDTSHAVYLAESAADAGADAILSVTPYYNKASASGLIRHFSTIADATSLPLILYNVPSRTGVSIPLSVYHKLAQHERIVGVKEAGTDMAATVRLFSELKDKLYIYSGNDEFTLSLLALGAVGSISVAANILPDKISSISNLWFSEAYAEAKELHLSLVPLFDTLFCEPNPIPVKEALHMLSLCSDRMRLPLCTAEDASKQRIEKCLAELGLIKKA